MQMNADKKVDSNSGIPTVLTSSVSRTPLFYIFNHKVRFRTPKSTPRFTRSPTVVRSTLKQHEVYVQNVQTKTVGWAVADTGYQPQLALPLEPKKCRKQIHSVKTILRMKFEGNNPKPSHNPMCQLSIDAFVRLAKFQLSEGFDAAQVSNRQMLITSMLINQANEKRAAATLKLYSRPFAACLNALNCNLCHVSGC